MSQSNAPPRKGFQKAVLKRKGTDMQDIALKPHFIVSVDEMLVARDIEMSIADLRPDAQIIVARTLAEVAAQLPQEGRVEAAFVQCDAARFLASGAGQRLIADGGRLVLVGQGVETATAGMQTLPQPFAHADIQGVLADLPRIGIGPRW